jgi:hypothetical protein
MTTHDWISDVFDDLQIYCKKNGLDETHALVQISKRIFESEKRAARPSAMTLEDHLRSVNGHVQ